MVVCVYGHYSGWIRHDDETQAPHEGVARRCRNDGGVHSTRANPGTGTTGTRLYTSA